MLKKYFLSALVFSGTLMPLYAANENSDNNRKNGVSFFEAVGISAALGAAWWIFFGEDAQKAPVERPRFDLRAENLGASVLDAFGAGKPDRYECELSVALYEQKYRVFLPKDKKEVEKVFGELERFVNDNVKERYQKEAVAQKVRRLREEFENEFAVSKFLLSRQLTQVGCGAVKPHHYVEKCLSIIDAAINAAKNKSN